MVKPKLGSIVKYSVGEKASVGTYTSPMVSAQDYHRRGVSMNNRSAWCYIDNDGDPHLVITNFQTGNEISDTVLDLATTHNFRTDYHAVRFGNMLAIAFSTTDSSVVVYEVSVNDGGATVAVEGSFEITQGSTFGTHVCFVEDRGTIFCISTANGSPTNEVFVFPCYMQGVVQSTMAVTEMVIECTLNADTDSIYAINSQTEPANFIFINGDDSSYCISLVSQGLATAVTVLSGLQNVSYYKANDDRYQETNTVTPLALSDDYVCAPNTVVGTYSVKPIMHSRSSGLIYVIGNELYMDRGTRNVRSLTAIYSDSTLASPTILNAYTDDNHLFIDVQEAATTGISFETISYDLQDSSLQIVNTSVKEFANASSEIAEVLIPTSADSIVSVGTGLIYEAFSSSEHPSFIDGDEYVQQFIDEAAMPNNVATSFFETFTATPAQDTFTLTYTPLSIIVHVNNAYQSPNSYSISVNQIIFDTPLVSGDKVDFDYLYGQDVPVFNDVMTTRGDIIYRDSSNLTDRLPVGSSGQVLSTDGVDVFWDDVAAGEIIYKSSTVSTVNINSLTPQTIFYLSLPSIAVGDMIVLEHWGKLRNNSGGNKTYTYTIDIGSTTFTISNPTAIANTTTGFSVHSVKTVFNVESTSLLNMITEFNSRTANTNDSSLTTAADLSTWGLGTSDETGTKTIAFKINTSATATTQTYQLLGYKLTHIK